MYIYKEKNHHKKEKNIRKKNKTEYKNNSKEEESHRNSGTTDSDSKQKFIHNQQQR